MKLPETPIDITIHLNEYERYHLIRALLNYDSPSAIRNRTSNAEEPIWKWQQVTKTHGTRTLTICNQFSPDK